MASDGIDPESLTSGTSRRGVLSFDTSETRRAAMSSGATMSAFVLGDVPYLSRALDCDFAGRLV